MNAERTADGAWDGWEDAQPEHVQLAIAKLRSDERMRPVWEAGFSQGDLWRAATEFEQASYRDEWASKTQAARDLWLAKFEKTAESFLELVQEAPRTPEQWGFPARDNVLMNIAYRMGVSLPPAEEQQGFFRRMLELEAAADAECWTLADALKHYREQVRIDSKPVQIVRKPGDAKAGRAEFIMRFRRSTNLSAQTVATVAGVMFDDENIDDRLVRRLTARRADFSES